MRPVSRQATTAYLRQHHVWYVSQKETSLHMVASRVCSMFLLFSVWKMHILRYFDLTCSYSCFLVFVIRVGIVVYEHSSQVLRAMSALPVVILEREGSKPRLDCISGDHVSGGMLTTRHSAALGHRRTGCIAGPSSLTSSEQRVDGYRQVMKESGVGLDEDLIHYGDLHPESGWTATRALLAPPRPPAAAFACTTSWPSASCLPRPSWLDASRRACRLSVTTTSNYPATPSLRSSSSPNPSARWPARRSDSCSGAAGARSNSSRRGNPCSSPCRCARPVAAALLHQLLSRRQPDKPEQYQRHGGRRVRVHY